MSVDDEFEIKPHSQFFDLGVVGIAALLTLCGIGMFFFKFTVGAPEPAKPATQPSEVTIGIGQGSTIRPQKPHPL